MICSNREQYIVYMNIHSVEDELSSCKCFSSGHTCYTSWCTVYINIYNQNTYQYLWYTSPFSTSIVCGSQCLFVSDVCIRVMHIITNVDGEKGFNEMENQCIYPINACILWFVFLMVVTCKWSSTFQIQYGLKPLNSDVY